MTDVPPSDVAAYERAHAARLETQRALEDMAIGYVAVDEDYGIRYVNTMAARMTGRHRDELVGSSLWDSFPGLQDMSFGAGFQRVMTSKVPESMEAYYPDLQRWLEVRAVPDDGGLGLYVLDISGRVRAEQAADRATRRLALLSDVSAGLARTLDADRAMSMLAGTVVPELADWCVITVAGDKGLRDVAAVHRSDAEHRHLQAYVDKQIGSLSEEGPIRLVMRTGEPVIIPRIRPDSMEQLLPDAELRGLLQQLDPGSAIAVPIRTPDRNLGVLALFYGAGHLPHDLYDLETALEIGRRAGLLIENATLYAGQRQLAETMQRSLLTEPPKADHLQVAVRYRPAAQQARVGGDWYDAFFTADGAVCLVIGDVAGHDGEAAATMGQVRNVLRGVAYTSTDRPAGVLSMLDRALRDLEVGDLATGTLIRVDRPELRKPSGDRLLRWSNAGHPPPVLVEPGGRARLLESDPDLLLGLDPGTDRTDHDVVLGAGGTVLLYTDGLVERRGASLDDGLAWLVEAVQELAYLDLEELCDALLEATADTTEDDVALLAVRSYDLVAGNDAGAAGSRGGSSGVGT